MSDDTNGNTDIGPLELCGSVPPNCFTFSGQEVGEIARLHEVNGVWRFDLAGHVEADEAARVMLDALNGLMAANGYWRPQFEDR